MESDSNVIPKATFLCLAPRDHATADDAQHQPVLDISKIKLLMSADVSNFSSRLTSGKVESRPNGHNR